MLSVLIYFKFAISANCEKSIHVYKFVIYAESNIIVCQFMKLLNICKL